MNIMPVRCGPSVTKTSLFLHLIGFAWYCHGVYQDLNYYNFTIYNAFGGRLQFLTMCTSYLIWISSGIACFVDLVQFVTGSLEEKAAPDLQKRAVLISIRDELMSFWVFSLGVFVSVMYWGIMAVDVNLLTWEEARSQIWGWFNNYLHTCPIFYVTLLTLFVNYEHPSVKKVLVYTFSSTTMFYFWMWHCSKKNGRWPYPFMGSFTKMQFMAFFTFSLLVFLFIYFIGKMVAALVWNGKQTYQDRNRKKAK